MPSIYSFAQTYFLGYDLRCQFHVKGIYLTVTSDNDKSVRLYKSMFFRIASLANGDFVYGL